MFSLTIGMERYVSSQATRKLMKHLIEEGKSEWQAATPLYFHNGILSLRYFTSDQRQRFPTGRLFSSALGPKFRIFPTVWPCSKRAESHDKGVSGRGFEEGRVYWIVTSKFSRSSFDFMLAIPRREFKRGRKWDIGIEMSTNWGGGGQRKFREESFDRL